MNSIARLRICELRKVFFGSLQPGKTYYYDIQQGEAGKGSFKTPPAAGEPIRFVVFGDTRTRHDVHRRLIQTILREPAPDFVLHTGDMVANGADSALWPIFFDAERELLRKAALFPVFGNHERNDQQFYDFFDMKQPYYSFTWGNCHFSMIDSDIPNVAATASSREAFWAAEVRWLEDDLAKNQNVDFRFVVAHHPPISAVSRRQGANKEMADLMPLLEKYKVAAGFFGHDHNYQHYLKNGIHYVTTGGGGAPLYDVDSPPAGITQKVVKIENFVMVSVTGKVAHLEAKSIDGAILDSFDIGQADSAEGLPSARLPTGNTQAELITRPRRSIKCERGCSSR